MTRVYFKDLECRVLDELTKAEESIKIAMAWIDLSIYEKILVEKSSNGIKIEILLDDNEKNQNQKELIKKIVCNNLSIDFIQKHNDYNTMHHKFCVIDDKVVLAGSFNWTNNAFYNFENLIVIDNDELVSKKYLSEFYEVSLYGKYMDLVNKNNLMTRLLYEESDTSRGGTEENNMYLYEVDNKTAEFSYCLLETTGTMITRDDTDFEEIYKWEVEAETQEDLALIQTMKEIYALDRMLELQSVALYYSRKENKIIDGIIVETIDHNGDIFYKTIWKNRFSKSIQEEYHF